VKIKKDFLLQRLEVFISKFWIGTNIDFFIF